MIRAGLAGRALPVYKNAEGRKKCLIALRMRRLVGTGLDSPGNEKSYATVSKDRRSTHPGRALSISSLCAWISSLSGAAYPSSSMSGANTLVRLIS